MRPAAWLVLLTLPLLGDACLAPRRIDSRSAAQAVRARPSLQRAERPRQDHHAASLQEARAGTLSSAQQLVTVRTEGWESMRGQLQCYERTSGGWRPAGPDTPAVVGRQGLGWGLGVIPATGLPGPVKREGDDRAPAGVFRLPGAFGFAPPEQAGTRLPYLQLQASTEAVDDTRSPRYNTVVDTSEVARDWQSAERMQRVAEYRWGLFVAHNTAPVIPGAGSCIFIHLWDGPEVGTSGCTALDEAALRALLGWLDPRAHPLLVQLPRSVYAQQRPSWCLP